MRAASLCQQGGQELSEPGDKEGRHLPCQPPDDGLQPPGRNLRQEQRLGRRNHRLHQNIHMVQEIRNVSFDCVSDW